MMPSNLAARWQLLCSPLDVPEAAGRAMFRQLSTAYEGSGRHYHTLAHVQALLTTMETHAARLHAVAQCHQLRPDWDHGSR